MPAAPCQSLPSLKRPWCHPSSQPHRQPAVARQSQAMPFLFQQETPPGSWPRAAPANHSSCLTSGKRSHTAREPPSEPHAPGCRPAGPPRSAFSWLRPLAACVPGPCATQSAAAKTPGMLVAIPGMWAWDPGAKAVTARGKRSTLASTTCTRFLRRRARLSSDSGQAQPFLRQHFTCSWHGSHAMTCRVQRSRLTLWDCLNPIKCQSCPIRAYQPEQQTTRTPRSGAALSVGHGRHPGK